MMKSISTLSLISISLSLVACGANKIVITPQTVKISSSFPAIPTDIASWIREFGDITEPEMVTKVIVDKNDDIYAVGVTDGDITDGGKFASKIGVNGGNDMFIVKYDKLGNKLWAYQIGTDRSDQTMGAASDSSGNICIVGNSYGDFAGPVKGLIQGVVICFDQMGKEYSRESFGDMLIGMNFTGADFDSLGNLYISGTEVDYKTGQNNGLIGKFDPISKSFSSMVFKSVGMFTVFQDIKIDSSNNVYVSGVTDKKFGDRYVGGISDAFLAKYDSSLVQQWAIEGGLSTMETDDAYRIALDSSDNIFFTTNRSDSMGKYIESAIIKVSPAGNLIWKHIEDSAGLFDVCVTNTGMVYAVGMKMSDVIITNLQDKGTTFDPIAPTIFGNPSGEDRAIGVDIDSSNEIYIGGSTHDGLSTSGVSADDAFLVKIK